GGGAWPRVRAGGGGGQVGYRSGRWGEAGGPSPLRFGAAEPGASIGRRPRRLIGAPTAPPPPRCAIRPRARVPHVFRRHAESKRAMALRRFMIRGVTKVRDEWDLACAA